MSSDGDQDSLYIKTLKTEKDAVLAKLETAQKELTAAEEDFAVAKFLLDKDSENDDRGMSFVKAEAKLKNIQNRIQELKDKEEKLSDKIEAAYKEEKEENALNIFDGFPSNVSVSFSSKYNVSSSSTFYPEVRKLEQKSFMPLQEIPRPFAGHASVLGMMFKQAKGSFVYANESGIASLVQAAVQDLCYAMDLGYTIIQEILVDNCRPDIWVVRLYGQVLAVIEVKRPDDPYVFQQANKSVRQINKYLHMLMNELGVNAPIGIITTYRQWAFYWLDQANPIAQATSLQDIIPSQSVSTNTTLYCSGPHSIVTRDGSPNTELPLLIASFLLKCSMIPRSYTRFRRPWLKYFSDRVEFVPKAEVKKMTLSLSHALPDYPDQMFYCWQLLGEGADGTSFLMSSLRGTGCVIKFCKKLDNLKQEVLAWKKAYGPQVVRTLQLCNRVVLMMPYIQILKDDEFTEQVRADIINHVKELASLGVLHKDLRRRHVGWWTDSEGSKHIRFIDWSRATLTDTAADVNLACDEAMKLLQWE